MSPPCLESYLPGVTPGPVKKAGKGTCCSGQDNATLFSAPLAAWTLAPQIRVRILTHLRVS